MGSHDQENPDLAAAIERARAELAGASRVLFITGAGISADSGLPTYRGVSGLYEDRATEDGIAIEEALSAAVFARQPATTWKYIRQIEAACRGARPNRAHQRIAELEREQGREVWVLTQNVDGLHAAAGSQRLIEIHGNVQRLRCVRCSFRQVVEDYSDLPERPECEACGALIRPEVVLFDEMLPDKALFDLQRQTRQGFDLVVVVGTTAVFPYIMQPVLECAHLGRPTIEINPARTQLSDVVSVRLPMRAAEAFELL